MLQVIAPEYTDCSSGSYYKAPPTYELYQDMDQDMKMRRKLVRAVTFSALLLSFSMGAMATQLKENSADIKQIVNVPGMAVAINPGGVGCHTGRHEVWQPEQNGCTNIDWVKQTARVVSLTATPPSILANNIATSTLLATLQDGDGYPVGPGIPTSWRASNGSLSNTSSVTNASGQTVVYLRGTVAGISTVTAAAVAGSASAQVSLLADPSTSRVVSLVASPPTVAADGTPSGLFAEVKDAYNNVLPAGQSVQWAATLGNLNTATSYTDASGIAYATIASGTAGSSTVYAKTPVSVNASTIVTFKNSAPSISDVTISGSKRLILDCNSITSIGNVFRWSAPGATRNELYATNTAEGVKLVYSGLASSHSITRYNVFYVGNLTTTINFMIRSFNGAAFSEYKFSMPIEYDCDTPTG